MESPPTGWPSTGGIAQHVQAHHVTIIVPVVGGHAPCGHSTPVGGMQPQALDRPSVAMVWSQQCHRRESVRTKKAACVPSTME